MEVKRCPHLGMQDDPGTRLDFPSPGNVCHKASPPGHIKLDYQHNTCLTAQHMGCPIYTAAHATAVPASILATTPRTAVTRRALPQMSTPVTVGLIAFFGLIVYLGAALLGNIPNAARTDGGTQDPARTGVFGLPQTGATQHSGTPDPTSVRRRTICPPPDGWVLYTVNPTDSIYRLSVLHAIPVADLQRANCMGNETVILPGEIIFIPFTPTLTPTPTRTRTRFIPTRTFTDRPEEDRPAPVATATIAPPTQAPSTPTPPITRVPPTLAPTTAVPPTPIPPTNPPPTDIPPTDVPPTDVPPTDEPPATEEPSPILPPIIETLLPPLIPPILPPGAQPSPGPG